MTKEKRNLFEMGADLGDGWSADNKQKSVTKKETTQKPSEKHHLYLSKEKRRGKTVTIVQPFYLAEKELKSLLKKLKKTLGTGGTVKENSLELQGDIAQEAQTALEAMQYRFRA